VRVPPAFTHLQHNNQSGHGRTVSTAWIVSRRLVPVTSKSVGDIGLIMSSCLLSSGGVA